MVVDEYTPLVWSVVRAFRLGDATSADAVQTTWLMLIEHLDDIREPARLPGWIRTTARRTCLKLLRGSPRETLVDFEGSSGYATTIGLFESSIGAPESDAVRREQVALLRLAIASLPERQRTLLGLLTATPALSYQQISDRLGVPIGSIGPTRARILDRLRGQLEAAGLHDAVPA
jgi:RNA polymerase sigma factor (sigma-70 family)